MKRRFIRDLAVSTTFAIPSRIGWSVIIRARRS
jgi:hypothetical protein